MLQSKKVVVVLPALNAEKTLERTVRELPGFVDETVLVDDGSADRTLEIARRLGLRHYAHRANMGYGACQKTCYRHALDLGAEVIVMVHPDYQYTPKLVPALVDMLMSGDYDIALGSRILGTGALNGGMPFYKYVSNRALTFAQNVLLNHKLSEYHTGFRAYTRRVLEALPLGENSNDFVFDNEILAQAVFFGYAIGEISCPTRYATDSSSINFRRSVVYGLGVLGTSLIYRLARWRLARPRLFKTDGRKLAEWPLESVESAPAPAKQA